MEYLSYQIFSHIQFISLTCKVTAPSLLNIGFLWTYFNRYSNITAIALNDCCSHLFKYCEKVTYFLKYFKKWGDCVCLQHQTIYYYLHVDSYFTLPYLIIFILHSNPNKHIVCSYSLVLQLFHWHYVFAGYFF